MLASAAAWLTRQRQSLNLCWDSSTCFDGCYVNTARGGEEPGPGTICDQCDQSVTGQSSDADSESS